MSQQNKNKLHTVNLSIAPERGLRKRDIALPFFVSGAEVNEPTVAAYGLGLGNGRRAALRVAGNLMTSQENGKIRPPGNVAVIPGFPYWKMSSVAALRGLAIEGWTAIFERLTAMNADAGVPRQTIHAGAESQAVPPLFWTCDENPKVYGKLAAVHPHGVLELTKGRVAGRLLLSALQPDQALDLQAYPVGSGALFRVLDDVFLNRCRGLNFATATSSNIGEALVRVVKDRGPENVRVFGGEHDLLYPAIPLTERLGDLGVGEVFELMPNATHTPHTARAGMPQMEQALNWMFGPFEPHAAA